MTHNGFLKGILIGGVAAGVCALLLAPKPGAKLLEDILNTYDHAKKNGHNFIDALKEKGASLTKMHQKEENHTPFLVGISLGAVVAGIAALLLAPDSGRKLRKLLGEEYDDIIGKAKDFASTVEETGEYALDELNDWKNTLASLIKKLSHNTAKGHFKINDILDLAQAGLGLFHQFQSRR